MECVKTDSRKHLIVLAEKQFCSGCTACYAICPCKAISMQEDFEGFKYPVINSSVCIECGLCMQACPALRVDSEGADGEPNSKDDYFYQEREPLSVYAALNKNDQVRMKSSSGGIFTLLAREVISKGGIVYGAGWSKDWRVVHKSAENENELTDLCGSKYVQSDLGDVHQHVWTQLKSGRKVLFSGSPCQVTGLRSFLDNQPRVFFEDHQLLLVDFICHAVPSPKVFQMYRKELEQRYASASQGINFRRKTFGWKRYAMYFDFKNGSEYLTPFNQDVFMRGFLLELINRPACYQCLYRGLRSGSDITLADYWGVQTRFPQMDDDRGTSIVMVTTKNGAAVFSSIQPEVKWLESDFEDVKRTNSAVYKSPVMHIKRNWFFEHLKPDSVVSRQIFVALRPSFFMRTRSRLSVLRRRIFF